nr:MAG TPA: hypothetical protein [Caudoviricetes sp.]
MNIARYMKLITAIMLFMVRKNDVTRSAKQVYH